MSDDELEAELANLVDLVDELEVDDDPEQPKSVKLVIEKKEGETNQDASARVALTPEYNAGISIWQLNQVNPSKESDLTTLIKHLDHQVQRLKDGDLGQAESMLMAQAHTLDALFHNLLQRSALNARNDFSVIEKLLKLAMKAQSQSRTTLDSLSSMKKPPPEPINQTNIAHGHQQVNNFPEKEKPPNELLEKTDGERLDAGTPQEAVRVDSDLETVDEQHRASIERRQN